VSLGFTRRARVGVAVGLAAACLALAGTPALAGGVRSQEWWLHKLHVTRAWQSTHAGGVTVAVLDTGVDPNQQDLSGAVATGPDYTSSGRVRGGTFWGVHGTAVASLIAGHGHGHNQSAGIMGIAPAATILSVRVTLESNDPLLADANIAAGLPGAIAHGIRYAVKHGAAVIDLPLDPVTTPGGPGAGGSPAERSAVAYALAHHVVLVAPAGDNTTSGTDPVNFPAAYPGVISVGAFDSTFSKASFTSQQSYVTVTGPGVGVIAASPHSGYAQVSSTSAASAIVAGIVALIRAQFPALSPAQVARALKESTVYRPTGGQNDGSGAGTVDAARALAAAARMIEAVPTSGPSAASGTPAAQAPPTPPAVRSGSRNLRSTLLLDVGIAVAVFLVLVVPILGYSRLRRRRVRSARLAEVRAAAQVPARRPRQTAAAGAGQDGYTPAPPTPGLPATMSSIGTGAGAAGGPRAAGESAFPGSAFPIAAHRDEPLSTTGRPTSAADPVVPGPAVPGPAVPGGAAGRVIGSHRMGAARTPRVSGSPPWEPAQEPTGEVPWARPTPAAGRPILPVPQPPAPPPPPEPPVPDISPWDAVAEEAWPGGPGAARSHAPLPTSGASATNGSHAQNSGNRQEGEDPDSSRPIYVWNPGAATESFPAVPPGEQNKS
jgi:subtilase family protein